MLTLVFAVYVVLVSSIAATGVDIKPIVGGNDATYTQFPYLVSLRISNNKIHHCGGSILSSQWILTAAHCVPEGTSASNINIVVGTIYRNSGGETYRVSNIVPHSEFDPDTLENDIAVLKVDRNITLDSTINVQSIRLACDTVPVNSSLIVSGWGFTNYDPNVSPNTLRYLKVTSITVGRCRDSFPEYVIRDTNQCTTTPEGKGACHGDSGGPLVYDLQQVGIVSWGISCARGRPDVFTSVPAFRNWIRDTTGV